MDVTDIMDATDITDVMDIMDVTDVAGVTDITDIMDITDVTDIMDITDITDITDIAAVTDITDVADVTDVARILWEVLSDIWPLVRIWGDTTLVEKYIQSKMNDQCHKTSKYCYISCKKVVLCLFRSKIKDCDFMFFYSNGAFTVSG